MGQRLKRWESPRQTGRNHKGRGGSARQRQLQKRQQTWRQHLREGGVASQGQAKQTKREGFHPPVLVSCSFAKALNTGFIHEPYVS